MKVQHLQLNSLPNPGKMEVVTIGRFVCRKYTGNFSHYSESLITRANTKLYYSEFSGMHWLPITGEGSTPELAIEDLKNRARELHSKLEMIFN